jgi:hypothetical protein
VGQNLRSKACKDAESSYRDAVRAIDKVPIRDCGVFTQNEFGAPVRLMNEMFVVTRGTTGHPVCFANSSIRF